jgi:hypothetical protein
MSMAFVLGNGTSRREVELQKLADFAPVYGCNALYREFVPTALIATDKPIAERIQHSGYAKNNRFHTRKPIAGLGANDVPKKYYGFSSGPLAVSIAALDGHHVIYMLGFDMGPNVLGKFNNIYADTEFYKRSADVPTYTGNWIRQIATVCQDFSKTQFIRVKGETTADVADFNGIKNIGHMPVADFLNRLNNRKDL